MWKGGRLFYKVMGISKQTIQDIKNRITPVDVIEYYTGQHAGKYVCPFHNDHNPSLTVKGKRWTCWSCGAKGDVIDFTMRFHNIGFRDAVVKLGRDFGVSVEMDDEPRRIDPAIQEQRILAEIQRNNRNEYKLWLDDEIYKLTTCRRLLAEYGAPEWEIEQYEAELDCLTMETVTMPYRVRMTDSEIWDFAEEERNRKIREYGGSKFD